MTSPTFFFFSLTQVIGAVSPDPNTAHHAIDKPLSKDLDSAV